MTIAKVVHIWNICGIGGLLARYLDRHYDYESIAIARASHDPYGHSNEKTLVWDNNARIWMLRCLWKAMNYDIIHLHGLINWVPSFRTLFPDKKIVLHLHGTVIRGKWKEFDIPRMIDMLLVSTKDLLDGSPNETLWLPNPVDEERIFGIRDAEKNRILGTAFHIDRYATDEAFEYADRHNLELFRHGKGTVAIKHEEFLNYLSKFEYYIDVKRDYPGHEHEAKIIPAFSMTGLEALALGLKVIDWKGDVHKGLPDHHRSEKVAKLLYEFYSWGWK